MLSERIRHLAEEVDSLVAEYESGIEVLREENVNLVEEMRLLNAEIRELSRENEILKQKLVIYGEE